MEGPCDGYEVLWYHNRLTDLCEQFVYGGCGGNHNRFANESACKERCLGISISCTLDSLLG